MSKLVSSRQGVVRSRGGNMVVLLVLLLFGAFMIMPFVYAVAQAIKPMEEIFEYPPKFFARNPTFENFSALSQATNSLWIPFARYLANSTFVTIVGTLLNVVLSSMAAFPLSMYTFPGKQKLSRIVTVALLFAGPVTALPLYIIMAKLQLINTPWAVVMPAVAAPLGLFLMKNFMLQLNRALVEAATVDGASIFRIFRSIILPNVKPAVFTLVIFTFQNLWNSTGGAYLYNEKIKLLPTLLSQIATSGISRSGVGAAASVVLMIPPCLLFIVLQSRVIETMASSGIKE